MSERDVAASTVAAFPAAAGDAVDPLAAPQERLDAVGAVASASEPARRPDLAAKLAVQLTPAQRRWVDEEAERRGIPKSAIVRDVVAAAIGGPAVDARVEAPPVVPDSRPVGGASASAGAEPPRVEAAPAAPPTPASPGGPGASVADGGSSGSVASAPVPDPARAPVRAAPVAPSTVASASGAQPPPRGAADGVASADPPPPQYARLPSGVSPPECDLPGPAPAVRESVPAEIVDAPTAAKALVLAGARDPSSLGFYVMVPGVGLVRTPPPPAFDVGSAKRVGPAPQADTSVMPHWMRVGIAVLCAAGVILAFAFLASSVVANRYYFQEVQTAPGRSVFYKVDRWTGEMTRCRTDLGAVGPVC